MIRRLCGDNALARVVLGTTHWGEDEKEEEMREQQLEKTFWNDSTSKSLRFDKTRESARAFLDAILSKLNHSVMILCAFSRLIVISTD